MIRQTLTSVQHQLPRGAISFVALLFLLLAAGLSDCGRDASEAVGNASGIPRSQLTETVRRMAEVQDSLFALPAVEAPSAQDVRDYYNLQQALYNPATRTAAQDSLLARWDRDPENFLWIELSHLTSRYFSDRNDLEQRFSRLAASDSTSFLARWLPVRRRLRNLEDRLEAYRALGEGGDGLTDLQYAWHQIWLARVEQLLKDPEAAVERMDALLVAAWETGGAPLASLLWYNLSGYVRTQGLLDDALFAADVARACADLDEHPSLIIRAGIYRGLALEERGEFTAAVKAYAECKAIAMEHHLLKLALQATLAGTQTNEALGRWRDCLSDQKRALGFAMQMADTLSAVRVSISIGESFRYLGEPDSCMTWIRRAEHLNTAGTPFRQEDWIARRKLNLFLQLGRYEQADSLRATMSGLMNDRTAFMQEMLMVEQAMETGRPDAVYRGLARADSMASTFTPTREFDQLLYHAQVSALFAARQGELRRADEFLAIARERAEAGATEHALWEQDIFAGRVTELMGDLESAAQHFSDAVARAAQLEAEDFEQRSRIWLGHVLLKQGRFEEARASLAPLTEVREYWPRLSARLFLGMIENRAGRPAEALRSLAAAADLLRPDSPRDLTQRLHLETGRALAASGRHREAYAELRQLDFDFSTNEGSGLDNKILKAFHRPYHLEYAEAVLDLLYDHPELYEGKSLPLGTLAIVEAMRWRADRLGKAPTVEELSSIVVPDGAVAAAFFLGQAGAYVWSGAGSEWSLHRIPDHGRLTSLLENVQIDMESPERQVHWKDARELARLLLEPIMDRWRVDEPLYLAATGRLGSLPWPALPLDDADPEAGPMLIEHGPVIHLTGISALDASPSHKRNARPHRLLALGLNAIGAGDRLRNAEAEAATIAGLWPADAVELHCGAAASWRTISAMDLRDFDAIHLATHARITQGLPNQSSIRLAGDEDRPLTIPEIGALDLSADLVFLSSCEGARSTSSSGSGMDSFVRAFIQAGAGSVLASTRPVDDHAAHLLAERFYRHWLGGKEKAAALRAAQLDVLSGDADWRHPFFWAHYRMQTSGR